MGVFDIIFLIECNNHESVDLVLVAHPDESKNKWTIKLWTGRRNVHNSSMCELMDLDSLDLMLVALYF